MLGSCMQARLGCAAAAGALPAAPLLRGANRGTGRARPCGCMRRIMQGWLGERRIGRLVGFTIQSVGKGLLLGAGSGMRFLLS